MRTCASATSAGVPSGNRYDYIKIHTGGRRDFNGNMLRALKF